MDKQKVVYTCNGTLFSQKNEQNADSCHSMDEFWKHYVKWNKPVIKVQIFYDFTHMKYLKYANS